MLCPVCGTEQSGSFCAQCGFDFSTDAERYPTLAPVPAGAILPVSARKALYIPPEPGTVPEPVPEDLPRECKKSTAMLLCILLGLVGAHKFYEGRLLQGLVRILMLALCFAGPAMLLLLLGAHLILLLVDLFRYLRLPKVYSVDPSLRWSLRNKPKTDK